MNNNQLTQVFNGKKGNGKLIKRYPLGGDPGLEGIIEFAQFLVNTYSKKTTI